jgi:xeroderma pigmentosum group C-complementing protein
VKDVTKKYVSNWMSQTLKLRTDEDWWSSTMILFAPPESNRDATEDRLIESRLAKQPLPTSISEFKNHPL